MLGGFGRNDTEWRGRSIRIGDRVTIDNQGNGKFRNLSVRGNIGTNAMIVIGNLAVGDKITADRLCVTGDAVIFGNVSFDSGMINIQGNCIVASDGITEVCVVPGQIDLVGSNVNLTGDLIVSGTTSLDVPLNVNSGGTNSASALNNNRVMVSSGGAIVEANALSDGQLLIGSSGGAPAAATISAGSGISVINLPNSITITSTQRVEMFSINSSGTFAAIPAFSSQYVYVSSGINPNLSSASTVVWEPNGGTSSITIVPGSVAGPSGDQISLSRRIVKMRIYSVLQFTTANTQMRLRLYLNGVLSFSSWLNANAARTGAIGQAPIPTHSVTEWGNVPAGTLIEIRYTNFQSANVQEAGSYIVFELQ